MRFALILAAGALCTLLISCGKDPASAYREDESTVAVVGRFAVDRIHLDETVKEVGEERDEVLLSRLLDRLLEEVLVLNDAKAESENSQIVPLDAMGSVELRHQTAERLLFDKVYGQIRISDEEVKTYYDAHPEEFTKGSGVLLQEIQVASRKEANRVNGLLKKGGFQKVAEEHSVTGDGGKARYFEDEELPEYLVPVIEKLSNGGYTSPIHISPETWQIVRLVRRTNRYVVPLEATAVTIRMRLTDQRAMERREAYLRNLREATQVTVFYDKLPFRYQKESP